MHTHIYICIHIPTYTCEYTHAAYVHTNATKKNTISMHRNFVAFLYKV